MFEYDEETKQWKARHHPFTSPKDGHEQYLESAPEKAYAKAYDMVLNGWEVAGGSVRIHRQEVQQQVFRGLKISPEDQRAKFGFLLDALQYGAPPHGGIAFGFDRLVALMAGVEAIRDVMAFPKTQRGQDLLTGAPSPVTEKQLRELHIRLRNRHAVKWLVVAGSGIRRVCLGGRHRRSPTCRPKRAQTLALIRAGGPFPYAQDGRTFGNREKTAAAARARLLSRVHGEDAGRARPRRAAHRGRRRRRVLLHGGPLPSFQRMRE